MPKPRLYDKRLEVRFPESLLGELEALAFAKTKGNVATLVRYILADWILKNQNEVTLAKMKLAEKKGVINLKKIDPGKWLTNKVLPK